MCTRMGFLLMFPEAVRGVLGSRSSSGREGDPIPKAMLPANVSILENEMSVPI